MGSAFLVWLLYYIGFYIIGLILNFMYLSEAKRIERETGISPSGKGCLSLLLFLHFWLPLLLLFLLLITGGALLGDLKDFWQGVVEFVK